MASNALSVLVLAAGKGTRMRSARPKVLHEVGRRSLLEHALTSAQALDPQEIVVVVGPGMEEVAAAARGILPDVRIAVQEQQLGTGDAVKSALPKLGERTRDLLVLFGDSPLIRAETIRAMVAEREAGADIVVLGFRPARSGALWPPRHQFRARGRKDRRVRGRIAGRARNRSLQLRNLLDRRRACRTAHERDQ